MRNWFCRIVLVLGIISLLGAMPMSQAFASATILKYDDGIMDEGIVPFSDEVGSEVAVRFTPTSYPARLQSVQFYVSGSSGEAARTLFAVRIYDDDNGSYPGARLDNGNITGEAGNANKWVTIYVSQQNITINQGDFFVSMYWLTPSGASGQNLDHTQTLGLDTTELDGRSFLKWGGSGSWHAMSYTSKGDRDAMIRAVVGESSGDLEIELGGGGVSRVDDPVSNNTEYWVQITDSDGIRDDEPFHAVKVQLPSGNPLTLDFHQKISGTSAYYHLWKSDISPQDGAYVFTVTAADGRSASITDEFESNPISPVNYQSIAVTEDGTAPMVLWDPVSGAAGYQVNIYDSTGDLYYFTSTTKATSIKIRPGGLQPYSQYRCRIRATREESCSENVQNASWSYLDRNKGTSFQTGAETNYPCEGLCYDDGGLESNVAPWSDEIGSEIAVRFTPAFYPSKLEKVKFFIGAHSEVNTEFGIRIYDDDNGDHPGTRIDRDNLPATALAGNTWVEVDISSENIAIEDGDFFVGMYWKKAPGNKGCFAQFLGVDKSLPIHGGSCWKRGNSGQWWVPQSDFPAYGNPMIRAVLSGTESYTLTVSKSGNGTVMSSPSGITCGTDCTEDYAKGTQVTLSASGDDFSGWSGDCDCSGTDPCTITMDQAREVTATFTQIGKHSLSVEKLGSGTVTSSPSGIACGTDCAEVYAEGTQVTLSASGDDFSGWSGDCDCSGTDPCTVTMDQAREVTATFTQVERILTVNKTGNGKVKVNKVSRTPTWTGTFERGTDVTLEAVPDAGYRFNNWSGDLDSGDNPTEIKMNANKTVTANFTKTYTLVITKSGEGIVECIPDLCVCGPDCRADFDDGTRVTLTAEWDENSVEFYGWSGACNNETIYCTIDMDEDKQVTAAFSGEGYYLSVEKQGRGAVKSNPAGIDCGNDCPKQEHWYDKDTTVTLTATSDCGAEFDGWTGACSGTGNPCIVTMNSAKSVKATFTDVNYTLSVNKTGNGTVSSDPPGINCGSDCSKEYTECPGVLLIATPDEGWNFAGWSGGGCSGNNETCTVTMDEGRTIAATFQKPLSEFIEIEDVGIHICDYDALRDGADGNICGGSCVWSNSYANPHISSNEDYRIPYGRTSDNKIRIDVSLKNNGDEQLNLKLKAIFKRHSENLTGNENKDQFEIEATASYAVGVGSNVAFYLPELGRYRILGNTDLGGETYGFVGYNLEIWAQSAAGEYQQIGSFDGRGGYGDDGKLIFHDWKASGAYGDVSPKSPYVLHVVHYEWGLGKLCESYGLNPPLEDFMEKAEGCLAGIWADYVEGDSDYKEDVGIMHVFETPKKVYKAAARIKKMLTGGYETTLDESNKAVEAISNAITCLISAARGKKYNKDVTACYDTWDDCWADKNDSDRYIKEKTKTQYRDRMYKLQDWPYEDENVQCEECKYDNPGDSSPHAITYFFLRSDEPLIEPVQLDPLTELGFQGDVRVCSNSGAKGLCVGTQLPAPLSAKNVGVTSSIEILFKAPLSWIAIYLADFEGNTTLAAYDSDGNVIEMLYISNSTSEQYMIEGVGGISKIVIASTSGWIGSMVYELIGAENETIHVDWKGECNSSVPCFESITDGIDWANTGGNIFVSPGSYGEDLKLKKNKVLRVTGGWEPGDGLDRTTVKSLRIRQGTVIPGNLIISPESMQTD